MKYLNQILSTLLAIPYLVLGSNYFFNFLPMPPMSGDAGAYLGLLYSTGMLAFIKTLEVVLGVLIVSNILRPLALVLIAPISVNIFLFEILIAHAPAVGVLLVILNAVLIYRYSEKYLPIIK